jgi:pantoate--beta-alanine ligase
MPDDPDRQESAMTSSPASDHPRQIDDWRRMREQVLQLRGAGKRVGVVPTMGALHEGHLRLVDASRQDCDATVVTIFVNPAQFGPHEDLDKYPRTLAQDLRLLAERGVDYAFTPTNDSVYPDGFSTYVLPPRVAAELEGAIRPDHFRGVATVVLKLFQMAPAQVAFFGQKDYQQTRVIKRMVEDLNLDIEIQVLPIVRESDGLAMSSRNRYLSADERRQAAALNRGLRDVERRIREGERDVQRLVRALRSLLADRGVSELDYVRIADCETLKELPAAEPPLVVLLAARVGSTRLIDNVVVSGS